MHFPRNEPQNLTEYLGERLEMTLTMRTQRRPKQRKEITLMKIKLVKSIMAPLVVACALVNVVAAETASMEGTRGGRLEGTWEMQITLNDCAGHVIRSFQSLIEFVAGGTVVESKRAHRRLRRRLEKVFGGISLTITMRFASNSSPLMLRTSLRAGRSLRAKQPWIGQETPIRGPQPSRSMTQTAYYL